MKPVSTLFLFYLLNTLLAAAQHPLMGTWEMISIKGISASGERFSNDSSTIREVKVITPTHYMLIAQDVEGDSLVFNRCYAGAIQLDGKKYNEIPILSSAPIFENVKTDYTWKVEGDRFIQSGTLIRPDGKKVVLEEMVFQRVKTGQAYPNNPSNGTWKLLSSNYITAEGTSHTDTHENVTCLQLITPTHWMYISSRDKKFERAMGGTYTMVGDKYYPRLDYASFPKNLWGKTEATEIVEGDTLRIKGVSVFPDGKKFSWEDLFERVK
jgi:hypothetical protein